MKSVLYAGAALMIGASIYGFVDLKNKSHKKEFTKLYREETPQTPVLTEKEKTVSPAIPEENKEATTVKKNQVTKNETIATETKSLKPVAENERMETTAVKNIEKPVVADNVTPKNDLEKKVVKKKKRLSTKLFSRAPIREEEINFVSEPEKPVKDTKKETTKEQ